MPLVAAIDRTARGRLRALLALIMCPILVCRRAAWLSAIGPSRIGLLPDDSVAQIRMFSCQEFLCQLITPLVRVSFRAGKVIFNPRTS
jgi:hypothetical protein